MELLDSCETEKYSLEIWECDCGFHIGIDATFLEQVDKIKISCPACGEILVIPEFE